MMNTETIVLIGGPQHGKRVVIESNDDEYQGGYQVVCERNGVVFGIYAKDRDLIIEQFAKLDPRCFKPDRDGIVELFELFDKHCDRDHLTQLKSKAYRVLMAGGPA